MARRLVWFSCGAASAVAAKLTLTRHPDAVIAYIDVGSEHPDNERFLADCERWFGADITRLKSERYADTWQVWTERRFLVGPVGALCTTELKKKVRRAFEQPDDIQVFGYTAEEVSRARRFREQNIEITLETPLIDRGLTKSDCLAIVDRAGIELPAMYRLGYSNNNCFAAETEFITDQGIRKLGDMAGRSVRVRGLGGGWKDATVESFGTQPLLRVTLERFSAEDHIYATAGHRWLVDDKRGPYAETPTVGLAPGMRLPYVTGGLAGRMRPSAFGIAAGIVFGDGTRSATLNTAATLMLCGDKNRQLAKFFPLSPQTETPDGLLVKDLPRHWKDAPTVEGESQSFLYGWLAGYFAADGCASKGSYMLTSASRQHLEVARDVCARLGIATNPIRSAMREGFPGRDSSAIHTLPLIGTTLREDFFLIEEHRRRYLAGTATKGRQPHPWFVKSVTPTDRAEEVFCAVVPDGQAFVLGNNVLTGNCVGCVKGGIGYWNKIRRDFPDVFDRMASLERDIGASVLRDDSGSVWLDELDPQRGDHASEPSFDCSLLCHLAEGEL